MKTKLLIFLSLVSVNSFYPVGSTEVSQLCNAALDKNSSMVNELIKTGVDYQAALKSLIKKYNFFVNKDWAVHNAYVELIGTKYYAQQARRYTKAIELINAIVAK